MKEVRVNPYIHSKMGYIIIYNANLREKIKAKRINIQDLQYAFQGKIDIFSYNYLHHQHYSLY